MEMDELDSNDDFCGRFCFHVYPKGDLRAHTFEKESRASQKGGER